MKKLKAVLLVSISVVLSMSFVSFKIPDININTGDSNVFLYVFSGICVVLISLFVFFASQGILQSKKSDLPSLFSSNEDDF